VLESLRAPPRPHDYVGLDVQGATVSVQGDVTVQGRAPMFQDDTQRLDEFGYLQVVEDPDYADRTTEVCRGCLCQLICEPICNLLTPKLLRHV